MENIPLVKQVEISLEGVDTHVSVQSFADTNVVLVSQLGRLGTIKHAEVIEGPEGRRTYEVRTLMGKRDDPLLDVYARQIVEKITEATSSTKPLLLTVALKKEGRSAAIFESVVNKILEMCV
jgi:proteasome assembly chaperone 3